MTKYMPSDSDVAEWVKTFLHKGVYDEPSRAYKSVGPKKWSDRQKAQAREAIVHYFQKEVDPRAVEEVEKESAPEVAPATPAVEPQEAASASGTFGPGLMDSAAESHPIAGMLLTAQRHHQLELSEILAVASCTTLPKEVRGEFSKLLKAIAQKEAELLGVAPAPKKRKRA